MKQNGVFFAIAPLFRGKLGFEDAQIVPSRCVELHRSRILSAMPFLVHEWNPLLLRNDFWRNFSQQGTPPRERSENVKTGGKCESRRQMPFGLAFTSYRPLKFCLFKFRKLNQRISAFARWAFSPLLKRLSATSEHLRNLNNMISEIGTSVS